MSIIEEHYAKSSSYVDTLKEQIADGMYNHLFYYGDGDEMEAKNDLVFLDIGANIGLVSIYAVPFCKRIVAIEPSPEVFPVLEANTKNYLAIEAYQCALAPTDAQCEFFVNDINSTASSTVNTYGTLTQVVGRTLTSILTDLSLDHVDVCKVDAEGSEGESLGLDQLEYAKDIVKEWWIEFHNCPKTGWEHKLGTAVGNFARLGHHQMEIRGMALWVKGRL